MSALEGNLQDPALSIINDTNWGWMEIIFQVWSTQR